MSWTIEGSDDRFNWSEIVSFNGAVLAAAAFDFELILEKWLWIRLVAPDGTIQERARTRTLEGTA